MFDGYPIPTKDIYDKHINQLNQIIGNVDNNLVENFENFTYIENANNHTFLEKWTNSYHEEILKFRKKKDKTELFSEIFCWWIEGFRSMIL